MTLLEAMIALALGDTKYIKNKDLNYSGQNLDSLEYWAGIAGTEREIHPESTGWEFDNE